MNHRKLFFTGILSGIAFLTLNPTARPTVASYTYDPAGRLIAADYASGKSISYAYDNAGNLIQSSAPSPALVVTSFAGNQLTIAWPVAPGTYVLESSADVGPGAIWTSTGTVPTPNGNRLTVTVSTASTTKFYRLHKQ